MEFAIVVGNSEDRRLTDRNGAVYECVVATDSGNTDSNRTQVCDKQFLIERH